MTHALNASEATMSGVAGRISAAEKAQMALKAEQSELRATIHITRAATGKVETYEIVGTPVGETTEAMEP